MSNRSTARSGRSRPAGVLAFAAGLALSAMLLAPAASFAQDAVTVNATTGDLGTFLVDADGRTLYFFTRDVTPGVSVCEDARCLAYWPALAVEEGQTITAGEGVTGTLGAITRADGTMQVAYRGRPLYYFAMDRAPGDTNGQGLNDVWFVAAEDGSSPPNPPAEDAPSPGPVGLTIETATSDLGTFLTGRDGLTLYFFAVDTVPGVSACEGDCLTAWPPATLAPGETVAAGEGVTGVLGIITGTDGNPQVTYDGRPLYYYQSDTEAGETFGQAIGDVWWVADVSGALTAAPAESMAPAE